MNLRVLVILSMLLCSIEADEGSCVHQISSTDGEVSSPNFPDFYPRSKECTWLFKITTGHRIKLVFDYFEIEQEQECAYDYVALYDGDSADSPLLGRFCGSKVPDPIFSTAQTMLMAFRSDASKQRKGFRATHSTVPCSDGYFDCGNGKCVSNLWTCNGVDNCGNSKDEEVCGSCGHQILSTNDVISSPNFPDIYPNNDKCTWLFNITTGHRIKLVFDYFELETRKECDFDYVALYDGDSADSPLLGRFCGDKVPDPILSSAQTMFMAFQSDGSVQKNGFRATYSIAPCSDGYFDCGNGRCVNNLWTCNGVDNCGNSKDEEDCGIQTVTPTYLPLQTTTKLVKSEESDGKIYKNETNIFSALRSLTEKVSSVEENQKHLMKSFEDISLNFTRLFLSKEVRPQEKEKDLSSAERKTSSDCEKFIDILRRMLDSRLK